jgi:hypothetical protein
MCNILLRCGVSGGWGREARYSVNTLAKLSGGTDRLHYHAHLPDVGRGSPNGSR